VIPHPYRRKGGAAWPGVSEPGRPGSFGVRPHEDADPQPAHHATGPKFVVPRQTGPVAWQDRKQGDDGGNGDE
jgi:hypothetical protein